MTDPAEISYVQVHTTTDSRERASKIARSAVEARVAACAQVIGPISSIYRWAGQVETAEEWLVLFKATYEGFDELAAHIRNEHAYDTPEIVATPIVAGSDAYLRWVATETSTD